MRLTTKGRVAVSTMIDLAARRRSGPTSLATMSERHRVSVSYLEHMFGSLRRHGLVRATRGPGGGYMLGRDAMAISVADIVRAVEATGGEGAPAQASSEPPSQRCATPELWASLNRCVLEFLDGITLQSMVGDAVRAEVAAEVKAAAAARPRPSRRAGKVEEPLRSLPVNSVFALGRAG